MHFITRERIHVDRIATAWAIRRFVDRDATFQFVAHGRDLSTAPGIPFDVRGAALGHHGGRCTLEALIDAYQIADEALRRMARIIRAADLPQEEPAPPTPESVPSSRASCRHWVPTHRFFSEPPTPAPRPTRQLDPTRAAPSPRKLSC